MKVRRVPPVLAAGLAGLGSAGLLLAALGFQHLGGLAPCHLCILQRWPHVAAVAIAVAAMAGPARIGRVLALAGALAMVVGAGLGVYHVGVEQGWWQGPASCTGVDPLGLTPEQFLDRLAATPLVRCDEVAWTFLGISMAGWNAIASAGLALIWLSARLPRGHADGPLRTGRAGR